MASAICLDYFYGDEVKMDSFFRLPRVLLSNEFCNGISTEVKYLYSLMLDRVSLSMRNGWREEGRVYIYFTLNDVKHMLNVGKNKAVKLFKQLETLDLIHRRKQGQGKPARIFVRRFVGFPEEIVEVPQETAGEAAPDLNCEEALMRKPESTEPESTEPESTEAPSFTEAAPMPKPMPEAPPKPMKPISPSIHDVKRPAPAAQEQRGQSSTTLPETKEATPNGIARLLAECAVGVHRLSDILTQRIANGGGAGVNGKRPESPCMRTI